MRQDSTVVPDTTSVTGYWVRLGPVRVLLVSYLCLNQDEILSPSNR